MHPKDADGLANGVNFLITSGQIRLHQTGAIESARGNKVWCNRICPEVIKNFMLKPAGHEMFPAHKY